MLHAKMSNYEMLNAKTSNDELRRWMVIAGVSTFLVLGLGAVLGAAYVSMGDSHTPVVAEKCHVHFGDESTTAQSIPRNSGRC